MQDYDQIRQIIADVRKVAEAMKRKAISVADVRNVQEISVEINQMLYYTKCLRFQREYDLEQEEDYYSCGGEILALAQLWEQSLNRRVGHAIDVEFWKTYEFFKYAAIDDIYQIVVQHFMSLPEAQRIEYLSLPHRYSFLKHQLDITTRDFSLIEEHVELMVNSVEKYKWLYENLADYRSKYILNGIIRYWFDFDIKRLHTLCEHIFPDYYDMDLLQGDQNEVLVDLGAYTGDSVKSYIRTYGSYKRIYAYECTPATCETLRETLRGYDNIILRQKGVGSKNDEMYVNNAKNCAGNHLMSEGDTLVEVVKLDSDIDEKISVIKMDIEGAEKDAILGAEGHIQNEKPRLLVSAYHIPGDLFDIPLLIHDLRDDYKFYLRFNGHGCLWPCDYVLYAL